MYYTSLYLAQRVKTSSVEKFPPNDYGLILLHIRIHVNRFVAMQYKVDVTQINIFSKKYLPQHPSRPNDDAAVNIYSEPDTFQDDPSTFT